MSYAWARIRRGSKNADEQQPMANRRHPSSRPIEDLRLTIDCLPVATREAMLDGIAGAERIIVGAYVDGEGGICPMLAAHRSGGRTSFISFAKSWDRFTRAGRKARRATRRELDILVGQLESSLMSEAGLDLDRAIVEHGELVDRSRSSRRTLADDADPVGEIVVRRRLKVFGRSLLGDKSAVGAERRSASPVALRR
jgi:hypothetical protein